MCKQKALIVDDDREIAGGIAIRLKSAGFETKCAFDGRAGLELAASYEPDVMILDVRMPQMNGLEVLHELKKQPGKQPPVIMVSASLLDQDHALECGATFFLKKPYSGQDLILAARKTIGLQECHAS
ncbi:MAG: response regulator [Planctomycetota bacterium]